MFPIAPDVSSESGYGISGIRIPICCAPVFAIFTDGLHPKETHQGGRIHLATSELSENLDEIVVNPTRTSLPY
jgi:hypothetical protein